MLLLLRLGDDGIRGDGGRSLGNILIDSLRLGGGGKDTAGAFGLKKLSLLLRGDWIPAKSLGE